MLLSARKCEKIHVTARVFGLIPQLDIQSLVLEDGGRTSHRLFVI